MNGSANAGTSHLSLGTVFYLVRLEEELETNSYDLLILSNPTAFGSFHGTFSPKVSSNYLES